MGAYNVVNPASLVSGQSEDISQVLANFNAIAAILNGNIDNSNINVAAAIAASKLAGYPADGTKLLKGDGTWAALVTAGTELGYTEQVVNQALVNGVYGDIVTLPSITFDGVTSIHLEAFIALVEPALVANASASFRFVGSVAGARNQILASPTGGSAGTNAGYDYMYLKSPKITPAAGAQIWKLQGQGNGGGGVTISSGSGFEVTWMKAIKA